jgi:gliding motility-associated-like protein
VNVVASPVTSFITSKDTACLGGHLFAFTDNTVFGSTYTSKWTLGDGTTGTAKNITGKGYLSAGKFDVKLVITTSAGCSDSLTKTVNVWPVPVANFAMNNLEQCLVGNSFVASNITQENSATGAAYTWYVKGIAVASTKAVSSQTMPDTGDYPVKLKVISDKGCATEKTLVLRVNEHPSVIVSGANACALAPIQFNAAAKVNRGSIASYSWNFADGGTANISNPKHSYATDGSYGVTVTVTSGKGCVTTTAAYPITVLPKPVANFDAEYLLSRGLETDWKFTFTGKNTDSYNWMFQDGQTSTSSNPFFMSFKGTGDFKVMLIASNSSGCADTFSKNIFLKPELLFYLPNAFSPNIDGLNEEFKPYQSFGISKYRMTIMNRWGEILFYSEDPNIGWKGLDSKGEPVMEGVYAFAVTFRYVDGAMHAYKGTVMIIK